MNKIFIYACALMMGLSVAACSSDSDNNENGNNNDEKYKDRSYGISAIDACAQTVTQLTQANEAIAKASLTAE